MTNKFERRWLLKQVEETLNTCSGCFLYTLHKRECGRTNAHSYCLSSCTVGEQLKRLGEKLNQNVSGQLPHNAIEPQDEENR